MDLKEELFQEISQEHGIDLLDSELNDIIDIVCKHKFKDISEEFKTFMEEMREDESILDYIIRTSISSAIVMCTEIVRKELEQP